MMKNKYDWVSNQDAINLEGNLKRVYPKIDSAIDSSNSAMSGEDMAIEGARAGYEFEAADGPVDAGAAAAGMSGAGMAAGLGGKVIAAGIQATTAQRAARLKSRQNAALHFAARAAGLGTGV